MRPLDVLIAVPSLLLVLLVAATLTPGPLGLTVLVGLAAVPDAARVVHAAAVEVSARPAVEALRMQGESWWHTAVGHVARALRRTLAADAGIRLTGALYLVSTAAFLGVGVDPDAADWAVMVDRNRTGLFLQPWGWSCPPYSSPPCPWAPICCSTRPCSAVAGEGDDVTHPHADAAPVAEVRDLRVEVDGRAVVDGIRLTVRPGGVTALVGPSGSGKTTTGRALLGEYPEGARVSGSVRTAGQAVGYVPQHPAIVLNPARRVGALLRDVARLRGGGRAEVRERVREALRRVQLPDPDEVVRRYPHQLSGGQQQRVVLAQAFLLGARVLVADEPTTGQDVVTRQGVVAQLAEVARAGMAVVLLSHDLDAVRLLADEVVLLREGRVVDRGAPASVLSVLPHQAPPADPRARPGARPGWRRGA